MSDPLLSVRQLTKRFFGIDALVDLSLDIDEGEIHAVVGENGAGKSTLMKLLVGVHAPDVGRIVWEGKPVAFDGPAAARRCGIDIVFQESELPNNLTVLEALFLGREPRSGGLLGRCIGRLDHASAYRQAVAALERVGVATPVERFIGELSVAERQRVQIARALAGDVRLLILDEPTSALGEREAERLFERLVELRSRGIAMLYVSHRLDEVFRLADRITVLRDGRHIATHRPDELTRESLVALIVGKPSPPPSNGLAGGTPQGVSGNSPPNPPIMGGSRAKARRDEPVVGTGSPHYWGAGGAPTPGLRGADGAFVTPPALELRGLGRRRQYHDVSFAIAPGEVLGLFGIVGAGRTEIARGIFGLDPIDAGTIFIAGRPLARRTPADGVAAGLAFVPEDRQHQGLVPGMSVGRNLTLSSLRRLATAGWIGGDAERRVVDEALTALFIRPRDPDVEVRLLSGGNQQKVVIGRWLALSPRVLILDEPTRGIDVGAKAEVHALIRRLASEGMAVLLISSELEETLALSDRLLVLRRGSIADEVDPRAVTPESVMALAL